MRNDTEFVSPNECFQCVLFGITTKVCLLELFKTPIKKPLKLVQVLDPVCAEFFDIKGVAER
jgi:hypothetical protein